MATKEDKNLKRSDHVQLCLAQKSHLLAPKQSMTPVVEYHFRYSNLPNNRVGSFNHVGGRFLEN